MATAGPSRPRKTRRRRPGQTGERLAARPAWASPRCKRQLYRKLRTTLNYGVARGEPVRLAVLEVRLAFFDESGHAFFLILGREQSMEVAAFGQHAFIQWHLVSSINAFFSHHH